MSYFTEQCNQSKTKIKVEWNLPNYKRKPNLAGATDINKLKFA